MAFEIIHAARRAQMAAAVIHGRAVVGQCDFKDVETLCASVMQLAQCCMYISAAMAEAGLTTKFKDSEIILAKGILPPENAKLIRDHFRASFEAIPEVRRKEFENEYGVEGQ